VNRISSDDKNRIAEIATHWYSLGDSSTHSAVAWLMRQWEIPEPTIPDAKQMVKDRDWFVNSQGATFVHIKSKSAELKPLPDPLEQVRQTLSEMEKATQEKKEIADFRYKRGRSLFLVGQYDAALADLDGVSRMQLDESMLRERSEIEQLRLLSLARLRRTEEADKALVQWSVSEPPDEYRDYVESLVPLWLGRKEAAIARLERGLTGAESADRALLYNLACAVALFAASEMVTAEEKRIWTDRSFAMLERWCQNSEQGRAQMREDPDLLVLHRDPRFVKLVSDRSNVLDHSYWLANCEVTRGEFEAFRNDNSYEGEKLKDRSETKLPFYKETSPTLAHPVQNVSWYDAVMYCNWLSRREGCTPAYRIAGRRTIKDFAGQEIEVDTWEEVDGASGYRLPSELEWEYACRAGSQTDWSIGSDEPLLAAYCQMFPSKLASPSGRKLPNAWGIHDMHGNVLEWCWDLEGSDRVDRGGSWRGVAADCRSAGRTRFAPASRNEFMGFRLALSSLSGIPNSPEAKSK
jgi:tetratricopeptide (TPR) repeat protein